MLMLVLGMSSNRKFGFRIMKTKNALTWLALILLAGLDSQLATTQAAVSVVLSPAAVSNTYAGPVTMTIAGLSTGGAVVVQKFLDLNNNGVVDAGDLLVQQFRLTDGVPGMVIGGVTNFNVPGDTDTSAGQITARWNFQAGDFAQNIVGRYLFKLSGSFTPALTNSFSVTNFSWPQKFTGTVYSNAGSMVVPNAVVMLMSGGHGHPVAGVVANSEGVYTLPAAAGTYGMFAFRSNYCAEIDNAPLVKLGAGATVTTNFSLTYTTSGISGKVVDANNPNVSLPGVLVHPQSSSGDMSIGVTDTNGNFKIGVLAGQSKLKADDTAFICYGYLGCQNSTNVSAGSTGLVLAVPKATALIYGRVVDNLGHPLVALDMYANDTVSNLFETDGYTDTNGDYVLGVVGLGTNDPWWMQANGNNQLTNYLFANETLTNNGALAAGTAVRQDFTAVLATNLIVGNVKFKGTNVAGLGVGANATINGVSYQAYVDTDANGNYSLNVCNGSWYVALENCGGSDSLGNLINGNYVAPSGPTINIFNHIVTNNFAILAATTQITGNVKTSNGNPIQGATLFADATMDGDNYRVWASTDKNGNYSLPLVTADWFVNIDSYGSGDCGNWESLAELLNTHFQPPAGQVVNMATGARTADFVVQLDAVTILTTNLADGEIGEFYDQWPLAATESGVTNWTFMSGSLPPGLNLSSGGEINGTPTSPGTYTFLVQVDDGDGDQAQTNVSITIYPAVLITTTTLVGSTNGLIYDVQLQATGGLPFGGGAPYSWSVSSGTPPPNLTLTTNGVLSGTLAGSGTFTFTVEVTDTLGGTCYQFFMLNIAASTPLSVTTSSLPYATNGAFYSQTLDAEGGTPPYSWSIPSYSASLPDNLTLTTNGVLSGSLAATTGWSYFDVLVTDAAANSVDETLEIYIYPAPLAPRDIPVGLGNLPS